jgi:hypothetical protein
LHPYSHLHRNHQDSQHKDLHQKELYYQLHGKVMAVVILLILHVQNLDVTAVTVKIVPVNV